MFEQYEKKWGWKSNRTQIIRISYALQRGLDFEGNSEPLQDFKEGVAGLIRSLWNRRMDLEGWGG